MVTQLFKITIYIKANWYSIGSQVEWFDNIEKGKWRLDKGAITLNDIGTVNL